MRDGWAAQWVSYLIFSTIMPNYNLWHETHEKSLTQNTLQKHF